MGKQQQEEPLGHLLESERKKLDKLYAQGPAAYGSVARLQKHSGYSKSKVEEYLHGNDSYTKYHGIRKKFPRLKVIAFRINEIWSLDLADVDKLKDYNNGVRFLLVAVDVLSRFLMVEPLQNKTAAATAIAFKKILRKRKPERVWSDKGGEFKGEFKLLCQKNNIVNYTTHSEMKSAFAERNIRSLKNIMYKYLEKNWTYTYLPALQDFVKTINTRVNRVTGLAPSKVTKKHVPHLVSLSTGVRQVRQPKYKIGNFVRIAKEEDIPFRKGYKQSFTDEIFEIVNIPTVNPPTYNLKDKSGETISGKFYEPELSKING